MKGMGETGKALLGLTLIVYSAMLVYLACMVNDEQMQVEGEMMKITPMIRGAGESFVEGMRGNHGSEEKDLLVALTIGSAMHSVEANKATIISDVVTASVSGFFPSNIVLLFDQLLNYNYYRASAAASAMLGGIASSYYNEYSVNPQYAYSTRGNIASIASQVANRISTIPMLSVSSDVPEQDSFLGAFLFSLPNITYQTFASPDDWYNGLSNASRVFTALSNTEFKGRYYDGIGDEKTWKCYDCSETFANIATNARILADATNYLDVEERASVLRTQH